MTNIIKKMVLEHLTNMELSQIFNESDFRTYYRKFNIGNSNSFLLSLVILDAFILNSKPFTE